MSSRSVRPKYASLKERVTRSRAAARCDGWGACRGCVSSQRIDAISVEVCARVGETVPLGAERGDLFALEEVKRVDARGAVAVRAEGVDVAEERGVGGAVCELGGGVCAWGLS